MLYIKANHLTDGLYNIKDGEIFKYKAKGGTVRTYEIGNIVRCKECKHWGNHKDADYDQSDFVYHCGHHDSSTTGDDFCSYGERSE